MKTFHTFISTFLFLFVFLCLYNNVLAQDTRPSKRDVSLNILNKRGRPLSKIVVQSLQTDKVGMTDRTGLFVFRDLADSDTISVFLPKYGKTLIPVTGMDSIVVTVRSSVQYTYNDIFGENQVIHKERTKPNDLLDVQKLLSMGSYDSLADLLQGRVSGLIIDPDGYATIRGASSRELRCEPLVVMDDVSIGVFSDANRRVNVNDIKTIEVEKTGWGISEACGVIRINTR